MHDWDPYAEAILRGAFDETPLAGTLRELVNAAKSTFGLRAAGDVLQAVTGVLLPNPAPAHTQLEKLQRQAARSFAILDGDDRVSLGELLAAAHAERDPLNREREFDQLQTFACKLLLEHANLAASVKEVAGGGRVGVSKPSRRPRKERPTPQRRTLAERFPPLDDHAARKRADALDPALEHVPAGLFQEMVLVEGPEGQELLIDGIPIEGVIKVAHEADYPLPSPENDLTLRGWVSRFGAPPNRAAALRLLAAFRRRPPTATQWAWAQSSSQVRASDKPCYLRERPAVAYPAPLRPPGDTVNQLPITHALVGVVELTR